MAEIKMGFRINESQKKEGQARQATLLTPLQVQSKVLLLGTKIAGMTNV